MNSYATHYRWKSKMSPWPSRVSANNCTQDTSSLKGNSWIKGKERGRRLLELFVVALRAPLLPSLQQSWCSRGKCNAAQASSKQLSLGKQFLSYKKDAIQQCGGKKLNMMNCNNTSHEVTLAMHLSLTLTSYWPLGEVWDKQKEIRAKAK